VVSMLIINFFRTDQQILEARKNMWSFPLRARLVSRIPAGSRPFPGEIFPLVRRSGIESRSFAPVSVYSRPGIFSRGISVPTAKRALIEEINSQASFILRLLLIGAFPPHIWGCWREIWQPVAELGCPLSLGEVKQL
jgi:hypothetical protein